MATPRKFETREQWLNELVKRLRPLYDKELPKKVHISIGFPSKGIRSKSIGECWHAVASADGAPQIFIHPKLADPIEVAAVVVHELIHACRPEAKHGAGFKQLAMKLGLTGRMTATVASDPLKKELRELIKGMGRYPHPMLTGGKSSIAPKQTTRLIKCACDDCGYTVRTTQKWLDIGVPQCPDGFPMEVC